MKANFIAWDNCCEIIIKGPALGKNISTLRLDNKNEFN